MNILKSAALASSLAFYFSIGLATPASAAHVDGIGAIDTNLPPPLLSFEAEYEDFDFLDVAKSVQLNGSQAGGNIPVGHKALSYSGDARFGRLGARSYIGGQVPSSPDLSTSVSVYMAFHDEIALANLNPLSGNNLRLDVELRGKMIGYGATNSGAATGKLTNARFSLGIANLSSTFGVGLSAVEFAWLGDEFFVTNTSDGFFPRFVPYPGEEPAFTNPISGSPGHFFGARGYIDIPLDEEFVNEDEEPLLAFGEPFVLNVVAHVTSSCGNEIPGCLAIANFDAVRIDNARLVDQNGDPVLGASFTAASGYDYVTGPVPEPSALALVMAAIATLASLRARR